jgi:hypothetical protein
MSIDPKCGELASYFLAGEKCTDEDVVSLAEAIQGQIEDWLKDRFEPHVHTCQQCDKVVTEDCTCTRGQYMTWCSSNCRAAYDL